MKRYVIVLMGLITPLLMCGNVVYAADANSEACAGIAIISETNCSNSGGESKITNAMKLAINIFSIVLGVIAVFAVMVAGVTIATSGGDSAKVSKARETLIYATIGLVVVAFAQAIARFVIDRVA